MTPRTLQTVLRSLADAEPPAGDAELLRRFVAGDEAAFADLVRRHGRLVWGVCRHLTRSDAEADDAFQATFLVLLRGARKVRDPGRLSAWLHGVAYKVCAKTRRAAERRAARERAAAVSERNGAAVPDSAWDRALAAVHEEAGRLPESLRVPFVLCCLEGKGQTEAAEQLGWKLGTLSGRLTRAKDAVLARLDARGLTLGAVAGLGLTAPPPSAVAAAAGLARAGSVIPDSVLQLTQGVIGMSVTSFKVLAAAALLACGLGVGVGTGWAPAAGAQAPAKQPPAKSDPETELKRLQAELERARLEVEAAAKRAAAADLLKAEALAADQRDLLKAAEALVAGNKIKDAASAKTSRWEYDFVVVSDMTQAKFVDFLRDRENRGWEYNGTTVLRHDGKPTDTWVFRRPAKGAVASSADEYSKLLGEHYRKLADSAAPRADDPKAIEAEITRLQERLATLRAKPKAAADRVVIPRKDLPLDPAELTEVLLKVAGKKFKNAQYTITPSSAGITIEGDKEVVEWAAALIKKLAEK